FLLKNKLEGMGRVTFEVLRRMVNDHPTDEFIFFFDRPYAPEFVFGKNVTPVVLAPPTRHPILIMAWFEFSVKRALDKYQPDVFFSTDGFCSLRTSVKTVVLIHDIAYQHFPEQVAFLVRKFYQSFQPRYLRKADQIITVSNFVKNDIVEKIGIPSEKITVVHNGCNNKFTPVEDAVKKVTQKKYSAGQPYFFYVGAVHPRKNVQGLITAFSIFKEKTNAPHRLLIGGRFAWQTGVVKTAFEKSNYQNDIQLLGYIPDKDLIELMGSAFAFVYVSFFEGFGLPILEAMESDVPVITSNISSMPEVAGDAGLLVNPHATDEIATAMIKYFENENLRQEKIEKGKQQREKFSWEQSAKMMYDTIGSLNDREP
ncbi:MAG: glycosyltransferase family 1 protein, partial [Bacteroidota bacterium]